jgi:hypothetical protein
VGNLVDGQFLRAQQLLVSDERSITPTELGSEKAADGPSAGKESAEESRALDGKAQRNGAAAHRKVVDRSLLCKSCETRDRLSQVN